MEQERFEENRIKQENYKRTGQNRKDDKRTRQRKIIIEPDRTGQNRTGKI